MLNGILQSKTEVPQEIRDFLLVVRDLVEEKVYSVVSTLCLCLLKCSQWDDDLTTYRSLGGFLFLRFVCPSLVACKPWGISSEQLHPNAHRQVLLLVKM